MQFAEKIHLTISVPMAGKNLNMRALSELSTISRQQKVRYFFSGLCSFVKKGKLEELKLNEKSVGVTDERVAMWTFSLRFFFPSLIWFPTVLESLIKNDDEANNYVYICFILSPNAFMKSQRISISWYWWLVSEKGEQNIRSPGVFLCFSSFSLSW